MHLCAYVCVFITMLLPHVIGMSISQLVHLVPCNAATELSTAHRSLVLSAVAWAMVC